MRAAPGGVPAIHCPTRLVSAWTMRTGRRRGEHMEARVQFQLVTVRWAGAFLEDLLDVPVVVLDFVASAGGAGPSCVKK